MKKFMITSVSLLTIFGIDMAQATHVDFGMELIDGAPATRVTTYRHGRAGFPISERSTSTNPFSSPYGWEDHRPSTSPTGRDFSGIAHLLVEHPRRKESRNNSPEISDKGSMPADSKKDQKASSYHFNLSDDEAVTE